jgi:hypothetical protein
VAAALGYAVGRKGNSAGEAALFKGQGGPDAWAQWWSGARVRDRRGDRGGAVGSDPGAA